MEEHQIRYTETLDYCDGIQLFAAADVDGGDYVAALVSVGKEGDQYLVVGCQPESLRMFRSGAIELKGLLAESAEQGWYLADVRDFGEAFSVSRQPGTVIPDNLLPDGGMYVGPVIKCNFP